MYQHILAPTDGSPVAQNGVDKAIALAKALGARVTIVTVTERLPVYADGFGHGPALSATMLADFEESQDRAAEGILSEAKQAAEKAGVPVETVHVKNAQPAEVINETASSRGCDLIVMSSHGRRGIRRLVLGSKTAEVLTQSPVPVLVVR